MERDYSELIKALRYCSQNKPCESCPYYEKHIDNCFPALRMDAADVIEELLAENTKLKASLNWRNDMLDIYEQAVDAFGVDHQLWVFVGEVAELLDDVADYKRGRCTVDDIAEEIADVEIMLEQLKVIYQCHGAVKYWHESKLKRLAKKLRLKGGGA